MKRKKTKTILFTTLFILTLASCGKNPSSFTELENLSDWNAAIEYAETFNGTYEALTTSEESENNVVYLKESAEVAMNGEKYYSLFISSELNEETNQFEEERSLVVIRNVNDNGTIRNKYYSEHTSEGITEKEGYYVSPSYATQLDDDRPTVDNYEEFFVGGETLDAIQEKLKDQFSNSENLQDLQIRRNKDLSVSLTLLFKEERIDEYLDAEGYLKTISDYQVEVKAKDGKIVEIYTSMESTDIFENEANNILFRSSSKKQFNYDTFDEKKYNSFSIETETTENKYYAYVNFDIHGYDFRYDDTENLFNETYTKEKAIQFLLAHFYLFIGNFDSSYFLIYLDKDFTQPFEQIELPETITLYVKMNIPEDKAIVFYTFIDLTKENSSVVLKIMYLWDRNTQFNPKQFWSENRVLSIDGKEVQNEDDLTFTLSENRVYIILCDSNGTLM